MADVTFATEDYGTRIERKWLAHYLNVSGSANRLWERFGKGIEEFNVEMNSEVEEVTDILGETEITVSQHKPTAEVEENFARKGTKLFDWLQDKIDKRAVLDDLKAEALEVHCWEDPTSGAYPAYLENVIIEITSYGGTSAGYQIGYTVHYTGERTAGTFNPSTKAWTAD